MFEGGPKYRGKPQGPPVGTDHCKFLSSHPPSTWAFHALFGRIGERAKMPFPVHPHMLRHGCGYALANAGHDTRALQAWLGHKNIQHTVRYAELAPDRFKNFWRH